MPSDIYLIRKNQNFAKYKQAEAVTLTATPSYSTAGITGNATTDILTGTVDAPAAGATVYFSSITGGSGLSANRQYTVINPSGLTFQLADTPSGSAINFTTNITAGTLVVLADDEIKVWSSEFRDTFATQGSVASEGGAISVPIAAQFSFPGIGSGAAGTDIVYSSPGGTTLATGADTTFTPTVSVMSDEAAHAPLRQTLLKRTHWKIDLGSAVTPRYLYACWQDGDTWSTNPPDTK